MIPYKHKVQYYETDKMGIVHHSNYIRWMEEARIDYLQQIGWSYEKFEEVGIISPVLAVQCKYKESTTFGDEIIIHMHIKEFNEIRLTFEYEMTKEGIDKVVLVGTSEHCFLDNKGKIIRVKKEYPAFYNTLVELYEKGC